MDRLLSPEEMRQAICVDYDMVSVHSAISQAQDAKTARIKDTECKEAVAKARKELIGAYDEYIALLGAEINELSGIAIAHGWHSSRVEHGKKARARLQQLKQEG